MIIINPQFGGSTQPIDISDKFNYDSDLFSNFEAMKFGNIVYLSFARVSNSLSYTYIKIDESIKSLITGAYIVPNAVFVNGGYDFTSVTNASVQTHYSIISVSPNNTNFNMYYYFCFQVI